MGRGEDKENTVVPGTMPILTVQVHFYVDFSPVTTCTGFGQCLGICGWRGLTVCIGPCLFIRGTWTFTGSVSSGSPGTSPPWILRNTLFWGSQSDT